jgi:hypothetical protein
MSLGAASVGSGRFRWAKIVKSRSLSRRLCSSQRIRTKSSVVLVLFVMTTSFVSDNAVLCSNPVQIFACVVFGQMLAKNGVRMTFSPTFADPTFKSTPMRIACWAAYFYVCVRVPRRDFGSSFGGFNVKSRKASRRLMLEAQLHVEPWPTQIVSISYACKSAGQRPFPTCSNPQIGSGQSPPERPSPTGKGAGAPPPSGSGRQPRRAERKRKGERR